MTSDTSRLRSRGVWIAVALAASLVTLEAQTVPTPSSGQGPRAEAAVDTELPARIGITNHTSLALDDALAQALANNNDIGSARVATERAAFDVAAALGGFDPSVGLRASLLRQQTPVSSLIGGSASGRLTQQNLVTGPQLAGVLPAFGTRYQLSLTAQRQTSDNQFTTLNPQYPSAFSASVTQPLFRGFHIDETRRRIEVARQNMSLSEVQLRQRVMDVALQTEQAYWDLALAEQALAIQRQGLELARQQVEGSRRLATQGAGAPIDVVEAETQVAVLEQNVYLAQSVVTRTENALKVLTLASRDSPIWTSALHASSTSRPEVQVEPLDAAVRLALANRPEMTQVAIATATNETNTRAFHDQTRPQVDLVGTFTSSGLAGRAVSAGPNPLTGGLQPLIDRINVLSGTQGLAPIGTSTGGTGSSVAPNLLGGYAQSLSTLAAADYPTFEVALQVSWPTRNRTAEANLAGARAEAHRIRLDGQRIEQAIVADVRTAAQAVASARERLSAATRARQLAEEQYASEQRRFQAGTSTVFFVVQRQTALIGSRTQLAQAETELRKAMAVFDRATGQILTTHNIVFK